jgi:hypothetical protein
MNGELEIVTEYVKSSCYLSGEIETTTGLANSPDKIQ